MRQISALWFQPPLLFFFFFFPLIVFHLQVQGQLASIEPSMLRELLVGCVRCSSAPWLPSSPITKEFLNAFIQACSRLLEGAGGTGVSYDDLMRIVSMGNNGRSNKEVSVVHLSFLLLFLFVSPSLFFLSLPLSLPPALSPSLFSLSIDGMRG